MKFFVENGIADAFYWGCYVIGFIAIFIFNSLYSKKYGISPVKALFFTVVSYAAIYGWAYVLGWVANGFTWGHHNAIRVFAWMPLVLLLTGKLFKIRWSTACDFIAPSTCLVYGIARLGCNFAGCCYGIPASWGIYSCEACHRCFPVQLCQSIASLAVFFIILSIAKKNGYDKSNRLYPEMLIMYGGSRFLLEFLIDNEKLVIGLSELAFWSIICVLIGIVWLLELQKRTEKRNH